MRNIALANPHWQIRTGKSALANPADEPQTRRQGETSVVRMGHPATAGRHAASVSVACDIFESVLLLSMLNNDIYSR